MFEGMEKCCNFAFQKEKMKKYIQYIYCRFHNLILYGIIGVFSAALDFAVYSFLVSVCGINYLISNCISVLVGIITSFYLNRKYNFKVKDHVRRRFIMFLAVGLSGLVMSDLILYFCIDMMSMDRFVSKLLSIVLVVFFQFLVNRYLTFKPTKENDTYTDNP